MRVHLGSDHAGFELKERLSEWLSEHGHDVVDHGPAGYDADDDYPTYVLPAARAVVDEPGSFGVVLGGSGNGEAIAANKVTGVRAALVWSRETARLAREHNDANVISLGARMHDPADALDFVAVFLDTPFSELDRHSRRIAMLTRYEASGEPLT
jgi:ribose 5-phosphate isomerase B